MLQASTQAVKMGEQSVAQTIRNRKRDGQAKNTSSLTIIAQLHLLQQSEDKNIVISATEDCLGPGLKFYRMRTVSISRHVFNSTNNSAHDAANTAVECYSDFWQHNKRVLPKT